MKTKNKEKEKIKEEIKKKKKKKGNVASPTSDFTKSPRGPGASPFFFFYLTLLDVFMKDFMTFLVKICISNKLVTGNISSSLERYFSQCLAFLLHYRFSYPHKRVHYGFL